MVIYKRSPKIQSERRKQLWAIICTTLSKMRFSSRQRLNPVLALYPMSLRSVIKKIRKKQSAYVYTKTPCTVSKTHKVKWVNCTDKINLFAAERNLCRKEFSAEVSFC